MVSSRRRSAASGASLFSGMVARVGAPITEATAPMLSSGAANCTRAPVGAGYRTAELVGGGNLGEPTGWPPGGGFDTSASSALH
jgi:hypothetical protein